MYPRSSLRMRLQRGHEDVTRMHFTQGVPRKARLRAHGKPVSTQEEPTRRLYVSVGTFDAEQHGQLRVHFFVGHLDGWVEVLVHLLYSVLPHTEDALPVCDAMMACRAPPLSGGGRGTVSPVVAYGPKVPGTSRGWTDPMHRSATPAPQTTVTIAHRSGGAVWATRCNTPIPSRLAMCRRSPEDQRT